MNEEVRVIRQEDGKFMPSVVSFSENEVLVGKLAIQEAIVNPENTIFGVKRIIGRRFDDPQLQEFLKTVVYRVENDGGNPKISVDFKGEKRLYDPEYITSFILKKLKMKAEINLGHKISNAVITVPDFFGDSQRQATKDAASLAGLNVLQILNSGTSVAIAYGLANTDKNGKNVLIYSFGSGMFDVSILKIKHGSIFETLATAGDINLGSFELVTVMVNYCAETFYKEHQKDIKSDARAVVRVRYACIRAKDILSRKNETDIIVDAVMDGTDLQVHLSRSKFEELCEHLFNRTIELLHQVVIDSCIDKEDIDDVLFVGGSCEIPKVRQLVSDYFGGRYISRSFDSPLAVACGAAVRAAHLVGQKDSKIQNIMCVDVTRLSIGIETEGGLMTTVIERGSPIPTKTKYILTTPTDNQTRVAIRVFEGERALACNNIFLGTLELSDLPPLPRGVIQVIVTFKIDSSGILTVTAEERSSMEFEKITIHFEKGRLSEEDIDRMLKEADEFGEEDEIERERIRHRNNLDNYIRSITRAAFADKENRVSNREKIEINRICNEVRNWLEENLAADIQVILQKRSDARLLLQPHLRNLDESVIKTDSD